MKVKILRGYLNKLPPDFDNKEVTVIDYKSGMVYDTPSNLVYVEDENDRQSLCLIFNYRKWGN